MFNRCRNLSVQAVSLCKVSETSLHLFLDHSTVMALNEILLFSAEQPVPLKFRTFILALHLRTIISGDCSTVMTGQAEFCVATLGPRDIFPCQIILLSLFFQLCSARMRHTKVTVWRVGGGVDGEDFRPSLAEAQCADGIHGRGESCIFCQV